MTDAGARVDLTADGAPPDGDAYVEQGLGADDVAALFYTSGTTGVRRVYRPRIKHLLRRGEYDRRPGCRTMWARDCALTCVPLFHVTVVFAAADCVVRRRYRADNACA